jgi:hypothetical protein
MGMETRSRRVDPPPPPPPQGGSHRYQPYRAPGTRMGLGSRHQTRVDLTSDLDLEEDRRRDSGYGPIDPGQRLHWGREQDHQQQDPQTIMGALELAWVSGGKTIVHPLEIPPSHSMHHRSVVAPLEIGNADSQLSRRGMEMTRRESRDLSQGNSVSWNSVNPEIQNLRPDVQGLEVSYSQPLGTWTGTEMYTPAQAVDQEQMERGSSSVELPDSTLETGTTGLKAQPQRVTSYSTALRMQQKEQLRRLRERSQAHLHLTPQSQTPPPQSPHHLGHLPQHHPHSLPMPLDHQRPDHTGHPAHLAHPSSQITMGSMGIMGDMHLGLSMDNMALVDMGAQTQAIPDNPRIQEDMQAADLPAPTYPRVLQ